MALVTTKLNLTVDGHICLRCGDTAASFEWPITINGRHPSYCYPCGRLMVEVLCGRAGADPAPWLRNLPVVT